MPSKKQRIKTVVINETCMYITTDSAKLVVLLKNSLSKTKQKHVLDTLTQDITTGEPKDILELLCTFNIHYYTVLDVQKIELPPTEADHEIMVHNLLGRYINKVIQLKSIYLKGSLLYISYDGGTIVYYMAINSMDSQYSEVYTKGVVKTVYDVLCRVTEDKIRDGQTILLTKLISELESILKIQVVEVVNSTNY